MHLTVPTMHCRLAAKVKDGIKSSAVKALFIGREDARSLTGS